MCYFLLVIVVLLKLLNRVALLRSLGMGATSGAGDDGGGSYNVLVAKLRKKDLPLRASLSSSRFVHSQSQHAQGSLPFS